MASTWYKDVWRIINGQKTSTGRTKDGLRVVNSPRSFKGLATSRQEEINAIIENEQIKQATRIFEGKPDRLKDIQERSARLQPMIINNYKQSIPLAERVRDAISRDISYGGNAAGGAGGVFNTTTNAGLRGQDPAMNNRINANVWISPMEAASIISQKGLAEIILRKKSQSILLNGVKIRCSMLTPGQHEKVAMSLISTGFAHEIANGIYNSLGYGGALMYPVFKRDTPLSMGLPIAQLAKYGIVGQNCIERYTVLDRSNVINIPNWNPTAKDFMNPDTYYIPFLGSDVSGERCTRIVTAPQPGYWGMLMTLGWGLSDIVGWIEAVYNYYNVMAAVPNMISQMSLLVRTFNVEGVAALEGSDIMDLVDREETMRVRQASINNPISMDVIGDLQAIKRDFQQVPELIRLTRQHAAMSTTIPEELFWSSERGNFSSGDTTDSAYEKQSEGTRYIHIDVARQLKQNAQLAVINALGVGRDVLKALPYVTVEFDNPRVTNAKDKAEIAGKITKGLFDMVASGIPVDSAMDISRQLSDDEFRVSSELMEELRRRQAIKDKREEEKHNKEMDLMDKQIESVGMAQEGGAVKPKKASSGDGEKKGHSYSDRLEQRKHETVGEGKKEGLQKAAGKAK